MKQRTHVYHGMSKWPEYQTWRSIQDRCHNPKARDYPGYGGRGIEVCPRWRALFSNFIEDMGRRPSWEHSIEREDNNKGYEPGNCIWATREVQNANKRPKRRHVREGLEDAAISLFSLGHSGSEVAAKLGIGVMTAYRIRREREAGARLHSQAPAK